MSIENWDWVNFFLSIFWTLIEVPSYNIHKYSTVVFSGNTGSLFSLMTVFQLSTGFCDINWFSFWKNEMPSPFRTPDLTISENSLKKSELIWDEENVIRTLSQLSSFWFAIRVFDFVEVLFLFWELWFSNKNF